MFNWSWTKPALTDAKRQASIANIKELDSYLVNEDDYQPVSDFSASDIMVYATLPFHNSRPVELKGATVLSISEHRDTFPVVGLGTAGIRGYTSGNRVTAGTIGFVVLNENPFSQLLQAYNAWRRHPEQIEFTGVDQLPPLELNIILRGSDNVFSAIQLKGVKFLDSSKNVSIRDIQLSDVYAFMASRCTTLIKERRSDTNHEIDLAGTKYQSTRAIITNSTQASTFTPITSSVIASGGGEDGPFCDDSAANWTVETVAVGTTNSVTFDVGDPPLVMRGAGITPWDQSSTSFTGKSASLVSIQGTVDIIVTSRPSLIATTPTLQVPVSIALDMYAAGSWTSTGAIDMSQLSITLESTLSDGVTTSYSGSGVSGVTPYYSSGYQYLGTEVRQVTTTRGGDGVYRGNASFSLNATIVRTFGTDASTNGATATALFTVGIAEGQCPVYTYAPNTRPVAADTSVVSWQHVSYPMD